jgi:hypothetical protein
LHSLPHGSNHHQSSSRSPQFSQDEKSNRQPTILAQCSLW